MILKKNILLFKTFNANKIYKNARNDTSFKNRFQISKNRCLSANSWNKSKHPGVNLYRQVLRDVGYKLSLINEFQGTMASNDIDSEAKKIYNTKYIIVPVIEDFINNDNGMIKNEENEEN